MKKLPISPVEAELFFANLRAATPRKKNNNNDISEQRDIRFSYEHHNVREPCPCGKHSFRKKPSGEFGPLQWWFCSHCGKTKIAGWYLVSQN